MQNLSILMGFARYLLSCCKRADYGAAKKVRKIMRFVEDMQIKRIFAVRIGLNLINLIIKDMTKADIVSEIAKSTGVEKVQVQAIVEAFMDSIKTSLTQKTTCISTDSLETIVKKRAKKVARNISKNTTITIPEHNIPAFKPARNSQRR